MKYLYDEHTVLDGDCLRGIVGTGPNNYQRRVIKFGPNCNRYNVWATDKVLPVHIWVEIDEFDEVKVYQPSELLYPLTILRDTLCFQIWSSSRVLKLEYTHPYSRVSPRVGYMQDGTAYRVKIKDGQLIETKVVDDLALPVIVFVAGDTVVSTDGAITRIASGPDHWDYDFPSESASLAPPVLINGCHLYRLHVNEARGIEYQPSFKQTLPYEIIEVKGCYLLCSDGSIWKHSDREYKQIDSIQLVPTTTRKRPVLFSEFDTALK